MFISSNELSYSRHFGSSSSVSYREPTIDFVLGGDSSSACYRELTNAFALFTYRMECKRHLSSLTPHYNANTFARISCVLSMCAYRPKYPVFLSEHPTGLVFVPDRQFEVDRPRFSSLHRPIPPQRLVCALHMRCGNSTLQQGIPLSRSLCFVHELLFMAHSLLARGLLEAYIRVYVCMCVLWGTLICIRVIFHL